MMDFREMGIDGANWIQLARDRVQWRNFLSMPLGTVVSLFYESVQ
jgi:hypothetical protein